MDNNNNNNYNNTNNNNNNNNNNINDSTNKKTRKRIILSTKLRKLKRLLRTESLKNQRKTYTKSWQVITYWTMRILYHKYGIQ